MKLSQMRYFQAVCLYGSTTRAADSLFVSQPSISMAIKELEEELHVKLFVRQNNRMMLTREGSFFLERVNRVLDEVRTLEQTMQHLNSSSTVTLSLPPIVGDFFPNLLDRFMQEYPDYRLEVYEDAQGEVTNLLRESERDFAVAILNSIGDQEFVTYPFLKVELMLWTNIHSPLAQKARVSFRDIGTSPIVLFKDSYYQNSIIKNYFQEAGIEPNVMMYASQTATMKNFARKNLASTFLFVEECPGEPLLRGVHFEHPIIFSVGLIRLRDKPLSKAQEAFLAHMLHTAPGTSASSQT